MQQSRSIGLLLYQYSLDHNGHYPPGKSSTEIFQKLIDDNYITDLTIFYLSMPGKTRPTSATLRPENVSWDVTICDGPMPDSTPLVFLTGYRISYTPGSSAIPLFKSMDGRLEGGAVTYKSNSARFIRADPSHHGEIPNFVPEDFNPAGHKFTQLPPDGPL